MTREERHIAVLSRLLENMDVYDSVQPTEERKKAIKAAIKALEQEMKRDKDCEWGRMTFDATSGISEFEFSDGTIKRVKQAELEPCEDAISREAVLDTTICEGISCNECSFNEIDGERGCLLRARIDELPSVTPSRPKGRCNTCKWYDEDGIYNPNCENCCRNYKDNYCGAEMIEPQESEDKE